MARLTSFGSLVPRIPTVSGNPWRENVAVDVYVIGWFTGELLLLGWLQVRSTGDEGRHFAWIARFLLSYRLFDIFQMAVNVFVFEAVQRPGPTAALYSRERTLILTGVNYLEIIVSFATLAYVSGVSFSPALASPSQALQYSVGLSTLLSVRRDTRGAVGLAILISQLMLSIMFLLLFLVRAVALVPPRMSR